MGWWRSATLPRGLDWERRVGYGLQRPPQWHLLRSTREKERDDRWSRRRAPHRLDPQDSIGYRHAQLHRNWEVDQ